MFVLRERQQLLKEAQQSMQKSISEETICQILKQVGSSSRRSHHKATVYLRYIADNSLLLVYTSTDDSFK